MWHVTDGRSENQNTTTEDTLNMNDDGDVKQGDETQPSKRQRSKQTESSRENRQQKQYDPTETDSPEDRTAVKRR